jgi:chromosome segregation ATPase
LNSDLYKELLAAKAGADKALVLEDRLRQLEGENHQLSDLLANISRERDLLKSSDLRANELQLKSSHLSAENLKLSSMVSTTAKDNDGLKVRAADADKNAYLLRESENKIALLVAEIDRLNGLVGERNREIDLLKGKNLELENKIHLLITENERLGRLVDDNHKQSEYWRAKYYELDGVQGRYTEAQALIAKLQDDNSALHSEINRLNNNLAEEYRRFDAKSKDFDLLRVRYSELENKLALLVNENQRLNVLIDGYIKDIESWKNRCFQLQNVERDLADTRNRVSILTSEIERLNNIVLDLRREKEGLYARIAELDAANNSLGANKIELQNKISLLVSENERLNNLINDLRREKDSLYVRLAELGDLHNNTNATKIEYQNKTTLLVSENERLNIILSERQREIEGWIRETDSWRSKSATLERVYTDNKLLENKIALLISENERLTDALGRYVR